MDNRIASMGFVQNLLVQQREQHIHDQKYHSDIFCMSRADRLKHYGLHYAKYAGRLTDGKTSTWERTIVDTALITLSVANTINQNLSNHVWYENSEHTTVGYRLTEFVKMTGIFARGCEKHDHLEENSIADIADANRGIFQWILDLINEKKETLSIFELIHSRRREISKKSISVAPMYIPYEGRVI